MKTRVKICGITNLADAQAAVEAGADALGFNFYEKSPRYVSLKTAAAISKQLPPFVMRVGVFLDAEADFVLRAIGEAGLTMLQFHGDEPPRMADMRTLFDAIINDDPLPEENDQNAQNLGTTSTKAPTTKKAPTPTATPEAQREQVTTTSPSDVTVRVSNATTQSGLATTATSQLKRDGFNVMTPDDYPSSVNATTVLFSPGNEQAAATVASSFANPKIQRVSGYGQVVQVVLGPDFKSVTAPPPSGSSISLQIERGSGNAPAKLPEDLTVTNAADTTCE